VSDPEPDSIFRERLLRVLTEADRKAAMLMSGERLDDLGRKYDRFRTGVPLKGLEAFSRADRERSEWWWRKR
jgi:hypothetical protein